MTSPLGQYAAVVAAATAILLIGAWVLAGLLEGFGILAPGTAQGLENNALLAIGAVFGSAVVSNGYKQPLAAMGAKVDAHTSQITTLGAVAAEAVPAAAPVIAESINPG